jgi:hypothetical protein
MGCAVAITGVKGVLGTNLSRTGPIVFLGLNELNFDAVREYIRLGYLPNFSRLLENHGYYTTTSERDYEHLEPWIQWVTIHTGKSYAEHQIFRLGDFHESPLPQIWETLEAKGFKVGAISPMNAVNRMRDPVFFMPDPWTEGRVVGSWLLKGLHTAIVNGVNENAGWRLSAKDCMFLLIGLIRYSGRSLWQQTLSTISSVRQPWHRVLILDRLIAAVYYTLFLEKRPDFSTLFLNGAAHLQHHYLFNSSVYRGSRTNPAWYIGKKADPVLDIYRVYDGIVGWFMRLKTVRLLIATGLHQEPYPTLEYYWRLKNHTDFLTRCGIHFAQVLPRMSRDFEVRFASPVDAKAAEDVLSTLHDGQEHTLFLVDNRGDTLFVTLTFPDPITENTHVVDRSNRVLLKDFSKHTAFVAIKNAGHHSSGYFVDSATRVVPAQTMPLSDIFRRLIAMADVRRSQQT